MTRNCQRIKRIAVMTTFFVVISSAGMGLASSVGTAHGGHGGPAKQLPTQAVQSGPTVTVYVQTEGGEPIRNARVQINRSGSVLTDGYTDSFGSFTTTLPSDEYTITVEAGGAQSESKVVTVEEDTVVEFTLSSGDGTSVEFVDFSMSVQGRHTGCPLNASYEIQNTGDIPYTESGTVGEDGQSETKLQVPVASSSGEMQPTPYRFMVSKPGYETLDVNYSIDNTTTAQVSLDPDKGHITVDVSAEIAGEYEVAENAMVTIRGRCRNTNQVAVQEKRERVDENGTVTFDKLPPANYTVVVEKHGYRNDVSHVTVGPDESTQVSAQLNLSQPSSLSMAVDEQLNFTASAQESQPLEEATLTIDYRNTDHEWERTTDANGEYTLERLPPGQYSVTVEKATETRQGARVGWQRAHLTTNVSLDEQKTVEADLHRNLSRIDTTAVHREKFAWEPLERKLENIGPASAVSVQLRHEQTGTVIPVTTDEAGGLTQALPTGAYELWTDQTIDRKHKSNVSLRTHVVEGGTAKDDGVPSSPARLHLDDGEDWTPDTGIVFVPRLASLWFNVVHEIDDPAKFYDKRRVANATVTITDSDGDTYTNQTNGYGGVFISRLSPGDATIEIQKEGYETTTETIDVHEWSAGRSSSELADDNLNTTKAAANVPPSDGSYFEFTIQEWDNCVEETDDAGNRYCDGEDGFTRDDGMIILTHRDENRTERFLTFAKDGDRLGPLPAGEYEVYLQDHVHDEATEWTGDTCQAESRVYQLNKKLDGGTTNVAFKYDKNETEPAPDRMPVDIRLRDLRTSESIQTAGTDATVTTKYTRIPNWCDGSTTRDETSGSPFVTDADGRPLERQFINPLIRLDPPDSTASDEAAIRFDPPASPASEDAPIRLYPPASPASDEISPNAVPDPQAQIDNVGALDSPYAAVSSTVAAFQGAIWSFYFANNSARVTGEVRSTGTNESLSNVSVSLGSFSETTGVNGEYSIAGVPNGEYQLTFSKDEYYSAIRPITVDEVTPGGQGGETVVTKPATQPIELEALPEPRLSVEWPVLGTFLDDVDLRYEWNVTIEEWALDTTRPGGNDAIESVDFYVEVNGTTRQLGSKQVELTPDDLPSEQTISFSISDLTTDLSTGEYREIDRFYVNLTTRRLGELQYGDEENETGAKKATIVATPPWLAATHELVRESQTQLTEEVKRKKETAISDIRGVLEGKPMEAKLKRKIKGRLPDENTVKVKQRTIFDGLGGSLVGQDVALIGAPIDLPDIYQARGIGFTARKTGSSATYEVGYKVMTGITYPLSDNVRAKVGLGRLGLPRADATMWMNGTIEGQQSEWQSQAQAEVTTSALVSDHYTTLPGPFALLPFNVASGKANVSYEEQSTATLPEEKTTYESAIATQGSMRVAVWDIIEMAADIETAGLAELVPAYGDVLLDWNLETAHDGSGPPFKDSEIPVVATDGDGYLTPNNASVAIEMRYGAALAERGFASAGGCGYNFQKLAKNIFSKVTGVNEYAPCGIDVKLTNLSTSEPYFERMDGELTLLSIEGEILGGAGFWPSGGTQLWTEPIHRQLGSGSPSTVEFSEIPTPVMTLDRWWLSLPNYGTARTWNQSGTVVNTTYPYADPSVAIHDGEIELFAGTDTGNESYASSLDLRRFTGTVEKLDETNGVPASTGALSPSIAMAETGDSALVAFTRLDAPDTGNFDPATLQTGDLYIAERTDGSWGMPQAITDNAAFDHGATVVDIGGGKYFLAWKAGHGNPTNGTYTSVEYALVGDGSVQKRGTVVKSGVISEPAVACNDAGCLVATAVRDSGESGRLTSSVVYSLVSDGTATDPEPIDSGSLVDVAATPEGFDVVFGDPGSIDQVHISNGTVTAQRLVADVRPRDLAVVTADSGPVTIWSNSEAAAIEYAEFNGSAWTDTETLASGTFHTSLSATVDTVNGTTLVATTTTPLSTDDPSVHLGLYTLEAASVPPVVGENQPTDPDGDGRYEDIDGDGAFDIFDVQALFEYLDTAAVTDNPQFFNFDGDENQEINIFDVQALFDELRNS